MSGLSVSVTYSPGPSPPGRKSWSRCCDVRRTWWFLKLNRERRRSTSLSRSDARSTSSALCRELRMVLRPSPDSKLRSRSRRMADLRRRSPVAEPVEDAILTAERLEQAESRRVASAE